MIRLVDSTVSHGNVEAGIEFINMNYLQAVEYLQSFPDMERGTHGSRGPTMSLDAMRSLLKRLGDPQNGRHTIHVTGSKGKGSTSNFIGSILHEAGIRTALFTSPHLDSYCERITIDMIPVDQEIFAQGLDEIRSAVDEEQKNNTISVFGILTALFFHIISKSTPKVDWQIVEVGMGGRYDVTNVFDQKDLAVVTPISLEHVEILGASQTEIATNKAGIITTGCTTILSPQKDASVRSVIGRQCHQVNADLIDVGARGVKIKQTSESLQGQSFTIDGTAYGSMQFDLKMLGAHQTVNAATAAIAAKVLQTKNLEISDQNISDGLKKTSVPGRFEIIAQADAVNNSPAIVVDGAHNHESSAALTSALKSLFGNKKCIFVIGVNVDKNINAMWRELHALCKTVITTKSTNLRAMDPKSLAEAINYQASDDHPNSTDNVQNALELALELATADDIIVVTGSLYLAAEARQWMKAKSG